VDGGAIKIVVVHFMAGEEEAVQTVTVDVDLLNSGSLENVSVDHFLEVGVPNGVEGKVL